MVQARVAAHPPAHRLSRRRAHHASQLWLPGRPIRDGDSPRRRLHRHPSTHASSRSREDRPTPPIEPRHRPATDTTRLSPDSYRPRRPLPLRRHQIRPGGTHRARGGDQNSLRCVGSSHRGRKRPPPHSHVRRARWRREDLAGREVGRGARLPGLARVRCRVRVVFLQPGHARAGCGII